MEVARVDEHVSHETPNLKSIHEKTRGIYSKWSMRFLSYFVLHYLRSLENLGYKIVNSTLKQLLEKLERTLNVPKLVQVYLLSIDFSIAL